MASVTLYDAPPRLEGFALPDLPRSAWADAAPDARAQSQGLREALDRGEVTAWFQPVHRPSDGALIGAEAFARWIRPGRPAVSAPALTALAERAGVSTRITEQVVAQALAFRRRIAAPEGFSIAVNLSSADLRDRGTVERLCARTDGCGASPGELVLEIAEGRLVDAPRSAIDVLARLRQRGFGLAVDDFGSGGSSLALLAQVPFGQLKVDARFLLAAPTDRVAEGIVDACAHLGRRLGLTLAAEGVETPAHRALCDRFGIVAAQGTRPGAAVPASEFAARHRAV